MTIKQTLLKIAAEVEEFPGRWTQNTSARNAKGESEYPRSQDAVCWCAIGFLHREYSAGSDDLYKATHLLGEVPRVVNTNDSTIKTPSEFVAWFRDAANKLDADNENS